MIDFACFNCSGSINESNIRYFRCIAFRYPNCITTRFPFSCWRSSLRQLHHWRWKARRVCHKTILPWSFSTWAVAVWTGRREPLLSHSHNSEIGTHAATSCVRKCTWRGSLQSWTEGEKDKPRWISGTKQRWSTKQNPSTRGETVNIHPWLELFENSIL